MRAGTPTASQPLALAPEHESDAITAESVVNDPSTPGPMPAFSHIGVVGRVQSPPTSQPSANAPTRFTMRVSTGKRVVGVREREVAREPQAGADEAAHGDGEIRAHPRGYARGGSASS